MGKIDDILAGQANDKLADVSGEEALSHMVGEGKKYATVEDLAKGSLNGQLHIGAIEKENAVFRDSSNKAKGIDDILAMLNGKEHQQEQENNQHDDDNHQKAASDEPSVADQIAAAFKGRDDQASVITETANVKEVAQKLGEMFGDKAGSIYAEVGKNLGINLEDLAKKSPAAVLKLVADARPANSSSNFQSTTNQQTAATGNVTRASIAEQYKAGTIDRYQKIAMENELYTLIGEAKFFE
jgi:hypothetical protein